MFEEYIHPLVDFARAHQVWAAPIVFALAFMESLAFISLLVPAWGALVLIGTVIGAGELNFWPIWIAGSIGAALGDWLSYWIGQKLEYRVQHIWPLSRHPDLIPRGQNFDFASASKSASFRATAVTRPTMRYSFSSGAASPPLFTRVTSPFACATPATTEASSRCRFDTCITTMPCGESLPR